MRWMEDVRDLGTCKQKCKQKRKYVHSPQHPLLLLINTMKSITTMLRLLRRRNQEVGWVICSNMVAANWRTTRILTATLTGVALAHRHQ